MRKILLAILTLTAFAACKKESKPVEVLGYYGDGKTISRRHTEIDGKKEGKMTDYYMDGSIKMERMFENNIEVGKTVVYYPSGKVKEVQYLEDGKLHGGDTVFFENGAPNFVRTFHKGLKDGYLRKWAEDGSMIYEAKFSMDTLIEVKGQPVEKRGPMEQDTFLFKNQ